MKKILHNYTDRQFAVLTAAAVVFLSAVMIFLNIGLYQRYRRNLIETEKGELLTMARTTGTSLQQHMRQEMRWIDLCLEDTGDADRAALEKISRQIVSRSNGLYAGCVGIMEGEIIFSVGEISDNPLRYAENAGGIIAVQSVRGKGTTFVMTFPVTPEPLEQRSDELADLFTSASASGSPDTDSDSRKTDDDTRETERRTSSEEARNREQPGIVCVCRSKKSLEPWKDYLESLPGSILYIFHEATFLARLQEHPDICRILIIEETLTGMRGIELAQIIRSQNPDIRILLLTGEETSNLKWYLDNGVIDGVCER